MTIIFPMAGLSQRFVNAGFTLPKYMLYVKQRSLFNLAVSSFKKYFSIHNFLFIARDIYGTREFIDRECILMGIKYYDIIILDKPTKGQAETVYEGISRAKIPMNESIVIFNIDTIRKNFEFPSKIIRWDGYLEVFEGNGENWSYAKTENPNSTKVIQTSEKIQISSYCSTGVYYFKTAELFLKAFSESNIQKIVGNLKELYVAPLYNNLISKMYNIQIHLIERQDVLFCGIPEEYYGLFKNSY